MKLYVAGKWEERARVNRFIHAARLRGHTITHNWTQESDEGLTGKERQTYLRSCAEDDRRGANSCEVLVLFDHPEGRGLFVEFGLALAQRKPVVVIGAPDLGPKCCIFYLLPNVVHVADEGQALNALDSPEALPHPKKEA